MYITTEERALEKKLIERMLSIPEKLPRYLADVQRGQWAVAQVRALPEIPHPDPIQQLNPAKPNFGVYFTILDLSPLGSILG